MFFDLLTRGPDGCVRRHDRTCKDGTSRLQFVFSANARNCIRLFQFFISIRFYINLVFGKFMPKPPVILAFKTRKLRKKSSDASHFCPRFRKTHFKSIIYTIGYFGMPCPLLSGEVRERSFPFMAALPCSLVPKQLPRNSLLREICRRNSKCVHLFDQSIRIF